MIDIISLIPGRKRKTSTGWYSFNAICCHHRGHKPDKRNRGGVIFQNETDWTYHCFNCQFKCSVSIGNQFGSRVKQLLSWCGVSDQDIDKMSFESWKHRDILKDLMTQRRSAITVSFKTVDLPESCEPFDFTNPNHKRDKEYLERRGIDYHSNKFYVFTKDYTNRPGIIIPYYYRQEIVGYTIRHYDDRTPKYISNQQRGFVFNLDRQHPENQILILVEGQIDAMSINGCAYLGSTINDDQARLISSLNKEVIVVPDHDRAGLEIGTRALELGYKISIPDWADDVKDVNDAVLKYGRLPTLLSILQNRTTNEIKLRMARGKFK
jgi:DNA primase